MTPHDDYMLSTNTVAVAVAVVADDTDDKTTCVVPVARIPACRRCCRLTICNGTLYGSVTISSRLLESLRNIKTMI